MKLSQPYSDTSVFPQNWLFAERHMPAVRSILGDLPARIFFDVATAPVKKDMEQATDLILSSVGSGDIAVRVRANKYFRRAHGYYEWSVRYYNKGCKTEYQKLKEGFGRWYFMAYSSDDDGKLAGWWLIDLDKVRVADILDKNWKVHPNGDGTSGMYIPIKELMLADCVVASHKPN